MAGPQTEAGKALLDDIAPLGSYGVSAEEYEMEGDEIRARSRYAVRIAKIEAEAVTAWLQSPEAVAALAEAIHGGRLQRGRYAGDRLCSHGDMPEALCPAATHRLHAEAILSALKENVT